MSIELPEWYSIGNRLIELASQKGLKFNAGDPESVAEIIQDYGIDCEIPLAIHVHKMIKEQIGNSYGEIEKVAMQLRQEGEFTLWYYGEKTNFDDEGIFNSVYYKIKPKSHEGIIRTALSTYEVAVNISNIYPQKNRAIILEKSGVGFGNGKVYEKFFEKWRKKKIANWSEKEREDFLGKKIEVTEILLQ